MNGSGNEMKKKERIEHHHQIKTSSPLRSNTKQKTTIHKNKENERRRGEIYCKNQHKNTKKKRKEKKKKKVEVKFLPKYFVNKLLIILLLSIFFSIFFLNKHQKEKIKHLLKKKRSKK